MIGGMLRPLRVGLTATLLAPALFACGGGKDVTQPKPDPTCMGPTPTRGAPLDGALEIGAYVSGDFSASTDGDTTELVRGSQGGVMAVPVFRVDASALGTDGACAYLKVIVSFDDASTPLSYDIRLPNSSPRDQYWFFTTLPLFLAYQESDVLGKTATYNAAFRDDGEEADAQVSLVLVDNE
jgi:hypothetical protein